MGKESNLIISRVRVDIYPKRNLFHVSTSCMQLSGIYESPEELFEIQDLKFEIQYLKFEFGIRKSVS
jgi:hypothetical protein